MAVTVRNVGQRTLYADNKWRTIFCTGCERSSTSKYWKCVCSIAWTACPLHSVIGFQAGKSSLASREQAVNACVVSFSAPSMNAKRQTIVDLHNQSVKRRKAATTISTEHFAIDSDDDHVVAHNADITEARPSSSRDLPILATRSATAANLDDNGAARAKPRAKVQARRPSTNIDNDSKAPRPPKRKLRGPYGSDPEARASHSKRLRSDPLAALNRMRNASLDPYLGPPQHTHTSPPSIDPDG